MVSEIWSYEGLKIADFTQQTVTQYCLTRRYLQIYASWSLHCWNLETIMQLTVCSFTLTLPGSESETALNREFFDASHQGHSMSLKLVTVNSQYAIN